LKIACKCGKLLTKDLLPSSKLKSGSFSIQKKEKYSWKEEDSEIKDYYKIIHVPPRLIVPEKSILDNIIPEFKEGYGCCNYSNGKELICECTNKLGEMYLDCHEIKAIYFLPKNINRIYS